MPREDQLAVVSAHSRLLLFPLRTALGLSVASSLACAVVEREPHLTSHSLVASHAGVALGPCGWLGAERVESHKVDGTAMCFADEPQ